MSVLRVQGISKSFGGVQAVNDVSFELGEGEICALIGPNGAGKSTCFNMMNGQLRPDCGNIQFRDTELVGKTPRAVWRLGIGRTFQITATFSSMTVRENVQMVLMSRHRRILNLASVANRLYAQQAMELLELVGVAEQANRPCAVLAYGDLKKVELAVAMADNPSLLLMDEPTAGMAPGERLELMELTAKIVRERGCSVLFTEHDMDVVFAHADRILVLHLGMLVAEGAPSEVRANEQVKEIYFGGGG
ncbi:MAG: ABC transporter ATP-binding protein [Gammaproteobacteria bacterium]|nr:ABC transporter ATP-binding protein [Gammaproteobacteria bacterium]